MSDPNRIKNQEAGQGAPFEKLLEKIQKEQRPSHEDENVAVCDLYGLSPDAVPYQREADFEVWGGDLRVSKDTLTQLGRRSITAIEFTEMSTIVKPHTVAKAFYQNIGATGEFPNAGDAAEAGFDILRNLSHFFFSDRKKNEGHWNNAARILKPISMGPSGNLITDLFGDDAYESFQRNILPDFQFAFGARLVDAVVTEYFQNNLSIEGFPKQAFRDIILQRYGFKSGTPKSAIAIIKTTTLSHIPDYNSNNTSQQKRQIDGLINNFVNKMRINYGTPQPQATISRAISIPMPLRVQRIDRIGMSTGTKTKEEYQSKAVFDYICNNPPVLRHYMIHRTVDRLKGLYAEAEMDTTGLEDLDELLLPALHLTFPFTNAYIADVIKELDHIQNPDISIEEIGTSVDHGIKIALGVKTRNQWINEKLWVPSYIYNDIKFFDDTIKQLEEMISAMKNAGIELRSKLKGRRKGEGTKATNELITFVRDQIGTLRNLQAISSTHGDDQASRTPKNKVIV